MPSTRRRLIIPFVLLILVALWWARRGGDAADAPRSPAVADGGDPSLLYDRLWLDSKPEKYTDYTHVMLVISDAPIGIFQKASSYRATTELFEYKRRGDRLQLAFPQTGTRKDVGYRVHACDDLPPFDLCLDLDASPWEGPRRYYGLADGEQEAARFGELRHHLQHHLAR